MHNQFRVSALTMLATIGFVAALLLAKWAGAQEQSCYRHTLTQGSGSVLICEPTTKRKPH